MNYFDLPFDADEFHVLAEALDKHGTADAQRLRQRLYEIRFEHAHQELGKYMERRRYEAHVRACKRFVELHEALTAA